MFSSFTNIKDFGKAVKKGNRHFWDKKPLEPGGTGVYGPASYITHPDLKNHTIYTPHPSSLGEHDKLPVLVWANGLGLSWGLMFGHFLREIASHGYIVIANGAPRDENVLRAAAGRLRRLDSTAMLEAVDWAIGAEACRDPLDVRAHVDGARVALAGQSRGGLDAYAAAAALRADTRVRTVGLFNSGLVFRPERLLRQVRGLTVPVFFVVGGPADLAHRNAEMDYDLLPEDLPAWLGNLDVGHMGTFYDDEQGGWFGRAAIDWLNAVMKGDEAAKRRMLQGYERDGWKVRSKNL